MPSACRCRDANFVATVHHGLPEDLLTPRPVTPELSGVPRSHLPGEAARTVRSGSHARAGMPLKIAAKVDRVDEAYFETTIRADDRRHRRRTDRRDQRAEKPDFLSGAIALLLPIDWPEPFGLVMIEAMACGTPVIAFNRGSVPEIVEHGVTGLIVESEAEAVEATSRVQRLSRASVRRSFERRFTAQRMAEDYLALYRRLAARARPTLRVVR